MKGGSREGGTRRKNLTRTRGGPQQKKEEKKIKTPNSLLPAAKKKTNKIKKAIQEFEGEKKNKAGADAILMHSKKADPSDIAAFVDKWENRHPGNKKKRNKKKKTKCKVASCKGKKQKNTERVEHELKKNTHTTQPES